MSRIPSEEEDNNGEEYPFADVDELEAPLATLRRTNNKETLKLGDYSVFLLFCRSCLS